ncbi:MAG: peptidase [Chloroflexi bacterium]|nr:peptidase [Chloroflexota bacterium]|tara:strand:+ start:8462 stop:10417 length:1956 start_codon:yes stop_codon:yes gene_type:complete
MNINNKTFTESWKSEISAELITKQGLRLSEIKIDGEKIYWLEGRPEESGRYVIVSKSLNESKIIDVLPRGYNSRNSVHEYGGASFTVKNNKVFFTNWDDQRIYCIDNKKIFPVTPSPHAEKSLRYSDLTLTEDAKWLICIRENHKNEGEPINEIVALKTDGSFEVKILISGNDFYSSPRLNKNNDKLTWTQWNHPNMPWDETELCTAQIDLKNCSIGEINFIAGGNGVSILQPEWSDKGELIYVSDESGWWNLHKSNNGKNKNILDESKEHAGPSWQFGFKTYDFYKKENIILRGLSDDKKEGLIRILDLNGIIREEINLHYTQISYLNVHGANLFFIGSSPSRNDEIIKYSIEDKSIEIIKKSSDLEIPNSELSIAEEIEFSTTNNSKAYAFYYPPKNKNYSNKDLNPPLLVISHGGPTSAASNSLSLSIQFWTNRGFAVVDVNYRGSTGYGRKYRDELKGNWGVYDAEDCIAAVKYLSEEKLIDPKKVVIKGGSAGGYTTINALTFYDNFAAGATYYGIADLSVFINDTHKFESMYLESLIGKYPKEKKKYYDRSAINFTEKLSAPMIILQGSEDKIVPVSQAEIMADALKKKQIPHALIIFEGEQHGFRKAENIKSSLESELYFYSQVLGFNLNENISIIKIQNSENL